MAQLVKHGRYTAAPATPIPGEKEYVSMPGNTYIQYIVDNLGVRRAPSVMDHIHDIADVTGLQTALDGKSALSHVHANATTSASGFMSAADKIKLDASVNYTHPNSGVTAGTYRSVSVNSLGHVTAGTNPTTLAGYGIAERYVSINPTYGEQVDNVNDVNLNDVVNASIFVGGNLTNRPVTAGSSGFAQTYNRASAAWQSFFDFATQDGQYYRRKQSGVWGAWEQVASRSWVQAQGYITSAAVPTLQAVLGAGNTAINQSISIQTPNGSTSSIASFGANGGYFEIYNGTAFTGTFLPTLRGINVGTNKAWGVGFIGQGQDDYTQGAITFSGRNAAGTGQVTTGNLVSFRNYTTEVFSVAANGNAAASGVIYASGGNSANWNTAFGWGNHAGLYLTSLPAHNLNFHSDVSITSPVNGQLLRHNGSVWTTFTPNYLTALPAHGLNTHSDVSITSPSNGQLLRYNGSVWTTFLPNYLTGISSGDVTGALGYTPYNSSNPNGYTSNNGTVTQVGLVVPTGFNVLSSAVTGSGNLQFGFASGYSLPPDWKQNQWDAKVGGNGATDGNWRAVAYWDSGISVTSDIDFAYNYGTKVLRVGALAGSSSSVMAFKVRGRTVFEDYSSPENSNALVSMNSGTKGFQPVRMTRSQRLTMSMTSADIGMEVYQIDQVGSSLKGKKIYDGSQWYHQLDNLASA